MHDLAIAGKIYNGQLHKVNKKKVSDNFNLPKVRRMTKITCQKLLIVTSNLFYF